MNNEVIEEVTWLAVLHLHKSTLIYFALFLCEDSSVTELRKGHTYIAKNHS